MTKKTGKDDHDLEETPDGIRGGKRTCKQIFAEADNRKHCHLCGRVCKGRYCWACAHYRLHIC